MVWMRASSWSRRSRISRVGRIPRSLIPRRHRSVSTDSALLPSGEGNRGKCTSLNPMSKRHRSAIASVRSQSPGASANSARISLAGLR